MGTRQEVIRKLIRDKIKPKSVVIHDAIQVAYKTQIRNSIAHSNYSFLGRNIHPNNFVKADKASQLNFLSFDDWINMFHTTLMLHNALIGLDNMIRKHYANLSEQGKSLEVKIIEPATKQYTMQVEYRPEWEDFRWKQD